MYLSCFCVFAHLQNSLLLLLLQERRAKEKGIEAAKKAVATAKSEKRKPDPEEVKLAEETIAKDETEEGQATQECEVGCVALRCFALVSCLCAGAEDGMCWCGALGMVLLGLFVLVRRTKGVFDVTVVRYFDFFLLLFCVVCFIGRRAKTFSKNKKCLSRRYFVNFHDAFLLFFCRSWLVYVRQVLDTRQTFLNLCQGNHYQFDMLRRGKHSSMMVSRVCYAERHATM